jgi:hypothetical protein
MYPQEISLDVLEDMNPRTRRMLMIGGAAAVGVTAASNRRGQGTSSGRQSMTRY